jgi:2-C-methyl-D-erythritol 2,4-cyclodiphosphate synthase
VGWGFDAHRFGGDPPLRLGGVVVAADRGLEGTSDSDVVAHAVADAVLGAAALADMGEWFPSSDPRWAGADSMEMLRTVAGRAAAEGWVPGHVDVTVVAQTVRVAPHRDTMRHNLAAALDVPVAVISVKATTSDGMGFTGRNEGIAAVAVVTAVRRPSGGEPGT